MDVLPPKWTELFQNQQVIVEQQEHNESNETHRPDEWHSPTYYKTYQTRPNGNHDHYPLLDNYRKCRKNCHSSDPCIMGSFSSNEQENPTKLHGTRFHLTKAIISLDNEKQDR